MVEAANSWINDFGKIRRCTERTQTTMQAYPDLAAGIVTVRGLIRQAWTHYRWHT